MMNNKLIFLIIGLTTIFAVICKFSNASPIVENWVGMEGNAPQGGGVIMSQKQGFLSVPGTYQSSITPRFMNCGFGANISYSLPSVDMLAVNPNDPLTIANLVESNQIKENFTSGEEKVQNSQRDLKYLETSQLLPTQTMDYGFAGSEDSNSMPIVYDRLMNSRRLSRLSAGADMIRGDLPIVPNCTGWFQVAANPSIDLQAGAMTVLGGAYNETPRKLADLIMDNTGGSRTAFQGVEWQTPNNSAMGIANAALKDISLGSSMGDTVYATGYP